MLISTLTEWRHPNRTCLHKHDKKNCLFLIHMATGVKTVSVQPPESKHAKLLKIEPERSDLIS